MEILDELNIVCNNWLFFIKLIDFPHNFQVSYLHCTKFSIKKVSKVYGEEQPPPYLELVSVQLRSSFLTQKARIGLTIMGWNLLDFCILKCRYLFEYVEVYYFRILESVDTICVSRSCESKSGINPAHFFLWNFLSSRCDLSFVIYVIRNMYLIVNNTFYD